jgi:hypothetical protein
LAGAVTVLVAGVEESVGFRAARFRATFPDPSSPRATLMVVSSQKKMITQ